jgi:predicted PurR-regulated permease PerM
VLDSIDRPLGDAESMTVRDPWLKALAIVLLLIGAVYLTGLVWQVASQFADIILLFFLAWIISFSLEPVVNFLKLRLGLARTAAVVATYATVLIAVTLAIIQLVPRLSRQVALFVEDLPLYFGWINGELLRLQSTLALHGILLSPESLLSYQEVVRQVESHGPSFVANTVGVATSMASLLFQAFIVLILSFYMTLDGERISAAALAVVPANYRPDARYFLASVDRAFAGFMRGQLVQAAIYGLGTAVVMSVAGLDLVLLPSLIAGLSMLIPMIGPVLAILLPLVITAATQPDSFLGVLLALFVLQQIVINVLSPRLMGHSVGLHPLLVFFAVFGGARVAGIWGAVFGVPIVAVAATMASFYRASLEEREARLQRASAAAEQAGPDPANGSVPTERLSEPAVRLNGEAPLEATSNPLAGKDATEL